MPYQYIVLGVMIVFAGAWLSASHFDSAKEGFYTHDEVLATATELKTHSADFQTYSTFFRNLAEDKGAVYAYEVLRYSDIPTNIDVHLLGHIVGGELYTQSGLGGMKFCTQDFRNACSHAVVIGAMLEQGMDVFDSVHEVCRQAPGGSGAYTMCFHGFGHGVLAYAEYDMEKAIELCLRTGTIRYNQREASECIGGAIMEMKEGIHDTDAWLLQKEKYIDLQNPLRLCQAEYMPEIAKERCYSYITPYLFQAAGATEEPPQSEVFARSMQFCESESDQQHRNECYAGFGKEFIVIALELNTQNIDRIDDEKIDLVVEWCNAAPTESAASICKLEVVNSLYWGAENPPAIPIRYCERLSDSLSDSCYQKLFSLVLQYKNDPIYKEAICRAVPAEVNSQCRNLLRV